MPQVAGESEGSRARSASLEWRGLARLLNVFGFSISATALTTGLGVVSNKIVAVWGGPELSGLVALFRQVYAGIAQGLSFGADVVVVQWVSSGTSNLARIAGVVLRYVLLAGAALILVSIFLSKWIAIALFGRDLGSSYALEIAIVVASSSIGLALIFVIAILNGFVSVRKVGALNVVSAAATATAAYLLISRWQSVGAALLVGFGNMVALAVGVWLLRRVIAQALSMRQSAAQAVKTLVSSGSLLTGLNVVALVVVVLVQAFVTRGYGLEGLALYSASSTIVNTFMMLFMSPMKAYVLPTVGGLPGPSDRAVFVNRALQFTLVLVFPCAIGVLVLRDFIVRALYSAAFGGAGNLLAIEALAIVPRTTSWVLAMAVLGAGLYKTYAVTELTRAAIIVFGCALAVAFNLGLPAVPWVFCLAYGTDLALYLGYSNRKLGLRLQAASAGLTAGMTLAMAALYLSHRHL